VFADRILEVAAALEDRSLPLLYARQATQQGIRERFETETAPDGSPWDAWSESYAPYAEAYPNLGILAQTQELEEVATRSDAFIISHDSVFYAPGMLPHYGLAHDAGLPDRKTPLPQRQFLGLAEDTMATIDAAFIGWFDEAIDMYITSRGNLGRRHKLRAAPVGGVGGGFFIPNT
jgi:hypothetical protein